MNEYFAPGDLAYLDAHDFLFDRTRLSYYLHDSRVAYRYESDLRNSLDQFCNNHQDADAFEGVQREIRHLLRQTYEYGQFFLYRRSVPGHPTHVRLLMLDRHGVEWTFARDDGTATYEFAQTYFRSAEAGDPLTAAIVCLRKRFLNFTGAEYRPIQAGNVETWSHFRFGWAAFWRAAWQPPVPLPRARLLDQPD